MERSTFWILCGLFILVLVLIVTSSNEGYWGRRGPWGYWGRPRWSWWRRPRYINRPIIVQGSSADSCIKRCAEGAESVIGTDEQKNSYFRKCVADSSCYNLF